MILLNEKRLATLNELQTVYNTSDLYDMLEILEVNSFFLAEEEKERNKNR